ncbi:MAG: diguanylate cyclase domain-containing protein [Candidatus Limnocylindrales bacterium]
MHTEATDKRDAGAVKRNCRIRAVYRRELQNSVRFSAIAVTAGIATATAIWCVTAPEETLPLAALSLPLVLAGIAIQGLARRRGRRFIVQLGMALGLLPIVYAAIAVLLMYQTGPLTLGTIGLMLAAFAVFIPLERRQHMVWLAAANAVFFALMLGFGRNSWWIDVPALAFAALIASGLSYAANETQLRRRRQINGQLLAVRRLYGRMKEHEQDLRRQDEFLFMQQETLVVQQDELIRLNGELGTIARLDALTGLGNRLRLNEDLAQISGRIERSGGTAGLLLMDLDHFKRLNDSKGHLAGDAALRAVADVLRKTSRVGDGVYRYGGEEFLVILHDADQAALKTAGQRYITAVEAARMAHPDNPPYGVLTASAGAVELSHANCLDVDIALHDADEALYEAKAKGRNRLEVRPRRAQAKVVPLDRERAAS